MVKRLKKEDVISREEYLQRIANLTDEQAVKLGYPSAKVMHLEDRLSELAGKWRRTKDDALVPEYKSVLYEMILNGYDVNTLPIQDQLPRNLMPDLPPEPVQMAIRSVYDSQ